MEYIWQNGEVSMLSSYIIENDTNIYIYIYIHTCFFEVYKLSKGTLVAKLANGKDSTLTCKDHEC